MLDSVDAYVGQLISEDYFERGAVWRKGVLAIACSPLTAPARLIQAEAQVDALQVLKYYYIDMYI